MKDLIQKSRLYTGTKKWVSVLTLCLEALRDAPQGRTCCTSLTFGLQAAGSEKLYNRPQTWGEKCVLEEDA